MPCTLGDVRLSRDIFGGGWWVLQKGIHDVTPGEERVSRQEAGGGGSAWG